MTTTVGRTERRRSAALFAWTALAAGVLTVAVLTLPGSGRAYYAPTLHVGLETANTVVALLVAFLLYGRFSRSDRAQELLLVLGLCVVAAANLALAALPSARSAGFTSWAALPVRLLPAVFFAGAALTSPNVRLSRRGTTVAIGSTVAAVAVLAGVGILWFSSRSGVALPESDVATYQPTDDWSVLTAHMIGAALFAAAAGALLRKALQTDEDELLRWMASGCVLAAFARVHYALFPSLYSDYMYTGDLLRLGFYVYLLIGASREIESYWRLQSETAVLEDRRRVARELHDGVIQELSYIRSESYLIPAQSGVRNVIIDACDRAIDEARAVVRVLGRAGDERLGFMLHRAAEELAGRYQVALQVSLDDAVEADPEQRHALIRITREAVSNAVRHGGAQRVCLQLSHDGGDRRLSILDDGAGFDVAAATGGNAGYGLVSMRERAKVLPGSLDIQAAAGTGCVVTVRW